MAGWPQRGGWVGERGTFLGPEVTGALPGGVPPPLPTDTELQLRRDSIFCQALVAAVCTFSEQLLAALSYRYNNNGEYEESGRDASRKWLEQVAATGVLLHCQSLLSPAVVSRGGGGLAHPVHSFSSYLSSATVTGPGDPTRDKTERFCTQWSYILVLGGRHKQVRKRNGIDQWLLPGQFYPWGHSAVSGGILGCHNYGKGSGATGVWCVEPRMLLNPLQHTGCSARPPAQLPAPGVKSAAVEKPSYLVIRGKIKLGRE